VSETVVSLAAQTIRRASVSRASLSKRSAAPAGVHVWVAGVCPNGPGPGGWAALLRVGERELELQGGAPLTTQARMTLTAAIESIRALPDRHARLTVAIDSANVVHALVKGWPATWREHGWTKHDGTPVRNRDLWELLVRETELHEAHWRGFAAEGRPEQARVAAVAAAQR
jgi:ribonuclease HI